MNNFVLQLFDNLGKKCSFYTVKWDSIDLSETDRFFLKYRENVNLKRSFQELAKFIEIIIGNDYVAKEEFFRFENKAQALPPTGNYQIGEITINYGNFPLRLFCLRISDNLVVLFNGGEKTNQKAQSSKISMAFIEANLFAEKILKALNDKTIFISNDGRRFICSGDNEEIIL